MAVKVEIELPELPAGKRYTGEFREVKNGEQYLYQHKDGQLISFWEGSPSYDFYLIIEDAWQRPSWMKPGWIWLIDSTWVWSDKQPVQGLSGYRYASGSVIMNVTFSTSCFNLEWVPPTFTGGVENSLIKV